MAKADQGLRIGELAKFAGVGVETIRFYEREGLLSPPLRRGSGYRQYPAEAVARVQFIRRAKDLGFTLKEIKELLTLRVDPVNSCADVRKLAREKVQTVETKIAELQKIKEALDSLVRACRGTGPSSSCPILDALANQKK